MRELLVVGIGTGHPDHITLEAVEALRTADVLLLPNKGEDKAGLLAVREALIARHLGDSCHRIVTYDMPARAADRDYLEAVEDWHEEIADRIARVLNDTLAEGETAAFLVWGDPALYDSMLRILGRLADVRVRVVAGISALTALTAAFGITLNRIGEPVMITPARKLVVPRPPMDTVVLLDGQQRFREVDGERFDIFWGAYIGLAQQILISGRLGAVVDMISAARTAARIRHGWIMDTYLLRARDSAARGQ